MLKVDEEKYPVGSCWIIACEESELSRHVPITTRMPPEAQDVKDFLVRHSIPHTGIEILAGGVCRGTMSLWPEWTELPWRNIVIMLTKRGTGHAESIHSKSQLDVLRDEYPFCSGVIDVGKFMVTCHLWKSANFRMRLPSSK